jgi:hypothetical protein
VGKILVNPPRILILAHHYAVCSARYMVDAFRRRGCDVRSLGAPLANRIWGMTVAEHYTWTPTPPDSGWTPDLIVVMDSDPALLDFAVSMQTAFSTQRTRHASSLQPAFRRDDARVVRHDAPAIPTVVYGVDNHVRVYRRPHFDHYFLAHRAVSLQPFAADTTWLPCAYDPVHFQPSPLPFEQRPYDVALVGVLYPGRIALIDALRRAGLTVFAATGLLYDGFAAAYHHARVSLCVSAAGDVAQRVFETAALGCVVVSDACPDLAALDADPVLTYDSLDAAVEACRAAQHQPERAAACLEWAAPHTWDARAEAILRTEVKGLRTE